MRLFGMTLTVRDRRPPGLMASGVIAAVKLRCGVLRATMTSAARVATSRASTAAVSASAVIRLKPDAVIRLKPDSTLASQRLLNLLLESDFVGRAEAVLLRQNLTAPIQQIVRRRHPHLVVVRR